MINLARLKNPQEVNSPRRSTRLNQLNSPKKSSRLNDQEVNSLPKLTRPDNQNVDDATLDLKISSVKRKLDLQNAPNEEEIMGENEFQVRMHYIKFLYCRVEYCIRIHNICIVFYLHHVLFAGATSSTPPHRL